MEQLELRWHGHACFTLTSSDFTLILDPYEDHYLPGLPPLNLTGHQVLCSHDHRDHNAAQVVQIQARQENPFQITTMETFHDHEKGKLRGKNTIHLVQCGSLRIAHFGDLGCTLTPTQLAELGKLDVAMIPVGGFYTIGPQEAKELVDAIRPKVVVPMHYRMGACGLQSVEEVTEFLSLIGDYIYYPGNSLILNAGTKPQVAVLSYRI